VYCGHRDLAQELLVQQTSLVATAVQSQLVTDVAEASVRLADNVAAALDVRQVRERVLLQDAWLGRAEPIRAFGVLVVRVLDALVLEDHPEDGAQPTDLPVAEVELQRRALLLLLRLRRHLLDGLRAETVAAHPLVVGAVVALPGDLHGGLAPVLRRRHDLHLGRIVDPLRLGLDPHALLELRVVVGDRLLRSLGGLLRSHG